MYFFKSLLLTLLSSKNIYLHLIHNAFIMIFPLEKTQGFIYALAFRGLTMLLIPKHFNITIIN